MFFAIDQAGARYKVIPMNEKGDPLSDTLITISSIEEEQKPADASVDEEEDPCQLLMLMLM